MDCSDDDWKNLEQLARRVGLADQRVSVLRRRLTSQQDRRGGPYTLVVGRPDAGIERLLARWAAPDAATTLQNTAGRPLVLGPYPDEIQPRLGRWPTWAWSGYTGGHLIAVRSSSALNPDTLAQLASLGWFDCLVLVTRLGQPMHQQEREHASSLAGIATTARALVVGIPGEEPTADDLAEVNAFAMTQLQKAGFGDGRCLSSAIWFPCDPAPSGTLVDVDDYLKVEPDASHAGRAGMARHAIRSILSEIHEKAQHTNAPPDAIIEPDEQDRLIREFSNHLKALGEDIRLHAESRSSATVDSLRSYTLDTVRAWTAGLGLEGNWLRYVDCLRPGTGEALVRCLESELSLLEYVPLPATPVSRDTPTRQTSLSLCARLGATTAPILLACGVGVLAYGLTELLLARLTAMPHALVTTVSTVCLLAVSILAFPLATRVLPNRTPSETLPPTSARSEPLGWDQIQNRLIVWLRSHFQTTTTDPADDCLALAARLNINL